VSLEFPVIKLLDYEKEQATLQATPNPFAIVVMAYLQTHKTRQNPKERLQSKLGLVKMLYGRGYSKQDILELFRFIDWVLVLPEELEAEFGEAVVKYEETLKMPYVTSVERLGIKKGLQKGIEKGLQKGIEKGLEKGLLQGELKSLREALLEVLHVRFGDLPPSLVVSINAMADPAALKRLLKLGVTSPSPEAFEKTLQTDTQ
jgi:hypothetical protein